MALGAARATVDDAAALAAAVTERDCLRCQEGSFRSFFLMAWCANEIRVMGRMNWKEEGGGSKNRFPIFYAATVFFRGYVQPPALDQWNAASVLANGREAVQEVSRDFKPKYTQYVL